MNVVTAIYATIKGWVTLVPLVAIVDGIASALLIGGLAGLRRYANGRSRPRISRRRRRCGRRKRSPQAHVSPTTVSRVLNNYPYVKEGRREIV